MAAMAVVAASLAAASRRRSTGTREISSTVSSRARGGQAAMICATGSGRACSTLAATDAATPRTRVNRTAQRTRRSCGNGGGWGGGVCTTSSFGLRAAGGRGWRWSGGVAAQRPGLAGAALQVGDGPVGQGEGVVCGFAVDLAHRPGQGAAQITDALDVAEPGGQVHGLPVERLVVAVVADR